MGLELFDEVVLLVVTLVEVVGKGELNAWVFEEKLVPCAEEDSEGVFGGVGADVEEVEATNCRFVLVLYCKHNPFALASFDNFDDHDMFGFQDRLEEFVLFEEV